MSGLVSESHTAEVVALDWLHDVQNPRDVIMDIQHNCYIHARLLLDRLTGEA